MANEPTTVNNDPNNPTPPTGTDPKPPVNADPNSNNFDPSKLTDEQLGKLYEDPRLYNHPRFKELAAAKKERDQLVLEKSEAEKKKLAEDGKFKELAEAAQKERDEAIQNLNNTKVESAIERTAAKLGAVDAEAVAKLLDRTNVKIDDTGTITGVEDAIKALQTSKPYLFGKGATATMGNPTNPSTSNAGIRYKKSQLQNAAFYQANEKDIMLAYKEGRIDNDLQ